MQSGFDINQLLQDAQTRWLKPPEVLFILRSHDNFQITQEAPQRPPSGSLFLFNKRVLRFFRRDGYSWRKKKDGRTVGEAHERLKVGNAEVLNCYYAHGEENPTFQRRSYWMLDPAYEHIVLVHYRDINEGRLNAGSISEFSPGPSSAFSQNPSTYTVENPGSASFSDLHESYQNHSSPGSIEVCSDAAMGKATDHLNRSNEAKNSRVSSKAEVSEALRRLEMQLSLDDDNLRDYVPVDDLGGNENVYGDLDDQLYSGHAELSSSNGLLQRGSGGNGRRQSIENGVSLNWNDVLELPHDSLHAQSKGEDMYILNANGDKQSYGMRAAQETSVAQCSEDIAQKCTYPSTPSIYEDFESRTGRFKDQQIPEYSPQVLSTTPELSTMVLNQSLGMSLEADSSLTIQIAKEQRFTIREISPEWGFTGETTKVIIIGSFLCDPSDSVWHCMFGDIEVPLQIVQHGVLSCQAPPHASGKVTLCITSGNRVSCSEVREFEYREKHITCVHCDKPEGETTRNTEELLLLVRFAQMLLSNTNSQQGKNTMSVDLSNEQNSDDESWGQMIEALLFDGGNSSGTLDWLLQQLLKDKLYKWLSSKSLQGDEIGCSLSKKEQGVIHMIAGLGYEWALNPILGCGVGINFRDINGWTALHWAARFGREKMVAGLIASGASAVAVTDPSSQDPNGKTPAHIAAASGHKGLAGYLSELSLTSHLSSLTLEESELSKVSADVEAEIAVNHIAKESFNTSDDQVSLKHTLAAVRNAAQAAARIQAAFRAHSFRRRQQREVATFAAFSGVDEYGFTPDDIQSLSAASKLAFRNVHDHNKAALSIQKNYRGWKGRKDFLALRQKVVKIQAHVRGYQVRKKYKVICWAVGILDKVVLRWRRKGAGLRGFKPDSECIDEDEEEDIVKVFRKEKVNVAIDEAVSRVLSMVECPEARQQYHRMLGKYQEAKAELQGQTSQGASSIMDNDGIFH